ncbi:MAG: T9SS type A sorting domain-containing protein [Bacteroidales bacterium]
MKKKILLFASTLLIAVGITNAQTVVFSETFETTTGIALPTGWVKTQPASNTTSGWKSGTALGNTGCPIPAHTRYVAVNDDATQVASQDPNVDNSNDLLRTPSINFSSTVAPYLTFDLSFAEAAPGYGKIEVSTNGGSTWTIVETLPLQSTSVAWSTHTTSLAAYAGMANIMVGFRYSDGGTWGYCMAVDNVKILDNSCPIDPNVYLTNIAFVKDVDAILSFTGLDLPTTFNYNTTNPNNFLDVNKPIRFKIKCFNHKVNGTSIISGLCKIRTTDPKIHLIDSTSSLNNVGYNSEAWSIDEFEILIDSSVHTSYTAYINFVVVEGTNQYSTNCIPIPIMPYTLASLTIDDDNNPDSHGNNNSIANPGEAVEINPYLNNTSIYQATKMYGKIFNYDNFYGINVWNNHPGVSGNVVDNGWWNYSFGTPQPIPAGSTNMVAQYDFVFDYNYCATFKFNLIAATYSGFYIFGPNNNPAYVPASVYLPINTGFPNVQPVATLTTNSVSSVTSTTASSGGNVECEGNAQVTQRGICYSTSSNPTTSNQKIISGNGSGSFNSTITGLLPNTTYHIRAFATNSFGTSYGNDVSFVTLQDIGINEASQNQFKVYPNPASSQINVQINQSLIGSSYTITDQIGKTVLSGKLNAEKSIIELGDLSGGIYLFSIGNNAKQTFKVIKK